MRALFRDRFVLLALALLVVPLAVYGLPGVRGSVGVRMWSGHFADPIFLGLVVGALVASRHAWAHEEERRFWGLILFTASLWFAGNVAPFVLMALRAPIAPDGIRDPLFFASFVTLVIAPDLQPHLRGGWSRSNPAFGFAVSATLLCVLGLVACFFLLPLVRHSGSDLTAGASLTFIALDLLIAIRFGYLAFVASGTPWVPIYAWLSLSSAASMVSDGLSLLLTTGALRLDFGTMLDAVWWLPFVTLVVARRRRVLQLAASPGEARAAPELPASGATGQLFLYALAFPATMLAFEATGLGPHNDRSTHLFVLAALLAFVGLAVAQHVVLERRHAVLRSQLSVLVTNEQLLQSQKLEAIGRLAGGLAHDFNNLLTVVLGSADLLASSLPPGGDRHDAERIRTAAERGAALTHQLLAFSRSQVMRTRSMDLNDTLREVEPILARLVGERHPLAISPTPGLRSIEAEPGQVFQVLLNLVANARDAMPDGGTIRIRTREVTLARVEPDLVPPAAGGSFAALEVHDDGAGIEASVRRRMFEPFSTTKLGGTGLGLAVVYGIVSQGGGHIRVTSEPGRGTTFEVLFPYAVAEPATHHRPVPRAARPMPALRTVLLVEDQANVREMLAGLLEALGYGVIAAANGPAALAALAHLENAPHVLLTDVVMPGMRGDQVAARVREHCPDIRVVYMSGFVDGPMDEVTSRNAGAGFLAKPFSIETLRAALDEALLDPRVPV